MYGTKSCSRMSVLVMGMMAGWWAAQCLSGAISPGQAIGYTTLAVYVIFLLGMSFQGVVDILRLFTVEIKVKA
ncbi:MAG: hypothetical protein NUV78_02035 [Candidatus Zambryskibacteria bacterium]|nr:hypothetical protein [Candidatus Zambryskibacteria bacterium]